MLPARLGEKLSIVSVHFILLARILSQVVSHPSDKNFWWSKIKEIS